MTLAFTKGAPPQPLAAAAVSCMGAGIAGIALISAPVNALALTGPLFMLQVYDRVLASRSVPTLIGLCVLAGGLYAFHALLDALRGRILLRVGERFDESFAARIHRGILRAPLIGQAAGDGLQPLRDLDNVRGFLAGPGPAAFFDLPWMPIYLCICFLFHFWLGMTALVGTVLLVGFTLATDALSRRPARDAIEHGMARNALMEAGRRNAEAVRAMGLEERLSQRWRQVNRAYLAANRRIGDVSGGLGSLARAFRLMLQSAILAVGAWLVIGQEVTAGVMIASAVMMGRALAPVDTAIGSWKGFLTARQSWARLKGFFACLPDEPKVMALPGPERELRAESLTIVPPGGRAPTVLDVGFALTAGSALGIIGPSGSGKSTLARALVGAWTPARGRVRLDGAGFDQWDREALGRHVGYLPQGVELFDGTIAENIARFAPEARPEAIIAAARVSGVHDFIVRLEKGYEMRIGEAGSMLSAGQRQRIGLARALYGDPFLVVLDEPNANLDAEGEAALVKAIASVRERNGVVVVIAHRPNVLGTIDLVMVMEAGRVKIFGPRDEVLSKVLKTQNGEFASHAHQPGARGLAPLRVVSGPVTFTQANGPIRSDQASTSADGDSDDKD